MKKIWSIAWKVGIVIAVVAVIVIANSIHKKTQIKEVNLIVNYENSDTLVSVPELKQILTISAGTLTGKEIEQINTQQLESLLKKNPFVAEVNAYITLQGYLNIQVKQRRPLVRVRTLTNKEFYIGQDGVSFPISKIKPSHVLIANGNIKTEPKEQEKPISVEVLRKDSVRSKSELIKIYDLARYIDAHPLLEAQIDQIYITQDNEYELVPKIGNHIILLGDINNLDEKFEKLIALYKYGFSNIGWDLYSVINLKFKDQVVCTKK